MSEYTLAELEIWNGKIEELVAVSGLSCYPQEFEICSADEMIGYEAYVGMPSHYPHWSYGKAFERQRTYYQHNLTGLPYEMVINSDPCLAYLMRDNTLLLQILTMAHVYGHNDFFKNNRLFRRDTRAELVLEQFKLHADRIRSYIQDPGIGPERVERILDAAHALRFQVARNGAHAARPVSGSKVDENLPTEDVLLFLLQRAPLEDWERDVLGIVREESLYFIPQLETKIMNEGWASFWHYRLLKQMELPPVLHMEFLQRHNLVIRPHPGGINPYFMGFKIFEYLHKQNGDAFILAVRESERDQSFLRRYLTQPLCEELHLLALQPKQEEAVITEVSDEEGWRIIRDLLVNTTGLGGIPVIQVNAVEKGKLILKHDYDGRELEAGYAAETLKYVQRLWGGPVELQTIVAGTEKAYQG